MSILHDTTKPVTKLNEWVGQLASEEGPTRQAARAALARVGKAAVPALLPLLTDQRELVRWEAAQALAEIADPSAAPAFVRLLEDREVGVRWVAATGLIAMGAAGLPPLLHALVSNSGSVILRHSAHRVIFDLVGRDRFAMLKPLLDALEAIEPAVTVPLAAQDALNQLTARR